MKTNQWRPGRTDSGGPNGVADGRFLPGSIGPRTPTSSAGAQAKRLSPAIPGLPIGDEIPLSPCADCAWRRGVWTMPGLSSWNGLTASRMGWFPTVSLTTASRRSSTRWMPRCGTSSRSTSSSKRCRRRSAASRGSISRSSRPPSSPSSRPTPPARATGSAATRTGCCPAAKPAGS